MSWNCYRFCLFARKFVIEPDLQTTETGYCKNIVSISLFVPLPSTIPNSFKNLSMVALWYEFFNQDCHTRINTTSPTINYYYFTNYQFHCETYFVG